MATHFASIAVAATLVLPSASLAQPTILAGQAVLLGVANQAPAPQKAPPARTAPPAKAPPSLPRMPDAVAEAIRVEASEGYVSRFLGIYDTRGKQYRLQVSTGRSRLAFSVAQAHVDGGKYTPKPADKVDVLHVNCGESAFGDVFNCAAVAVRDAKGIAVKPVRYEAGTNGYRNALGATWSVREVSAAYPIAGLQDGFTVGYRSVDDVEYEIAVSAEDAIKKLFLGSDPEQWKARQ